MAVGSQEFRDTETALVSAKAAVAEDPSQQLYRNTLGVVQYQAGQWDDAILSLNASITMRGFADSHDAFFLAMAHWQRGEHDVAQRAGRRQLPGTTTADWQRGEQDLTREWLAKAIDWMDKNAVDDPELIQFRKEAEALVVGEK